MTKIIFLDIDGVLNRLGIINRTKTKWGAFIGMEPELVERFNLLCIDTGAKVVLSSTWRHDEDWLETMRANGLTCEFLGRTPHFPGSERGEEVDHWICQYLGVDGQNINGYAILDDDADFFPMQPLFKTDYRHGLTPEIAKAIENRLGFRI